MRGIIDNLLKEKRNTSEFKVEIGTHIKDNKRDLIITNREYRPSYNKEGKIRQNRKYYKNTCNICGWTEGWISEGNLLFGCGCSCCCGRTAVLGINTIWDKNRWMCNLGVSEEDAKTHTSQSSDKVYTTCPDCGKVKDKPMTIYSINKRHSISCTCSDKNSYPNKFAYSLLDQLNEIYKFDHLEHEYSPDWIKPKRYDNYFVHNGKEYILEMDGGWHKKDNNLSGKTKEESKTDDNEKDLKAKDRGIVVIRIECEKSESDYIKHNIISKINILFDLSKINWLKCEEFALSNLVKVACDYWNSGIKSTTKIGLIMKIHRATVTRYLKNGKIYNWCDYNSKEEMRKASSINGKTLGKQVKILKDGISLGVYPSCHELERKSEEIFGIKLTKSAISKVAIGKKPQYKGFTFKYIKEIEQAI